MDTILYYINVVLATSFFYIEADHSTSLYSSFKVHHFASQVSVYIYIVGFSFPFMYRLLKCTSEVPISFLKQVTFLYLFQFPSSSLEIKELLFALFKNVPIIAL